MSVELLKIALVSVKQHTKSRRECVQGPVTSTCVVRRFDSCGYAKQYIVRLSSVRLC